MVKEVKIVNFKKFSNVTVALEKVAKIIGPNGYGKTSFLQAMKWGLLGDFKTEYASASPCSVEITFDDGTVIKRTYTDKQEVRVNGTVSTQTAAKEIALQKLHCTSEVAHAMFDVTSFEEYAKDVVAFRAFLLSFLPVKVKKESFFRFMEESLGRSFTDAEKTYFENRFSNRDSFTISDIDTLYKCFYDERKEANKQVKELKPKTEYDPSTIPTEKKEELMEELSKISVMEKEASDYQQKREKYLRLAEQKKKMEARKTEIEKALESYKDIKKPERTIDAIRTEKKALQTEYESTAKEMAQSDAILKTYKTAYFGFSKKTCPYLPEFQCPADHEKMIKDLIEKGKIQRAISDKAEEKMTEIREKAEALDKEIDEVNKISNILVKKDALEAELAHLVIPELPEEPKEVKAADLTAKKQEVTAKIAKLEQVKTALDNQKVYGELVVKAEMLQTAVKLFDDKGVKNVILMNTLTPLERIVNENGYTIHLMSGGVFAPVIEVNGNEVPFGLLSSGEFIMVCFQIMKAIQRITNVNILLIDNVDKLDKDNTNLFMELVEKSDAFENIIISGVNHEDSIVGNITF